MSFPLRSFPPLSSSCFLFSRGKMILVLSNPRSGQIRRSLASSSKGTSGSGSGQEGDPPGDQTRVEELRRAAETRLGEQKEMLSAKWEEVKDNWNKEAGNKMKPEDTGQEWYYEKVSFWMKRYEDFVGLTEVKAAQAKVVQLEKDFVDIQERRREIQMEMSSISSKLKEIHSALEKTYRGEDKYLTLITEEHQVLKEERNLLSEFQNTEKNERHCFSKLSNAVRDSHEKERAQAEKTKYWSVIGSVVGTILGIGFSTFSNWRRMREVRQIVSRSANGNGEMEKTIQAHEVKLGELVGNIQHMITDSKLSVMKIGELREVSEKLQRATDRLNVKDLENQTGLVLRRNEELSRILTGQQKQFQDIRNDMKNQTTAFIDISESSRKDLNNLVDKDSIRDEQMRSSFESLYKNQANILTILQSKIQSTETKVSDVQALIQALQSSAASRRKQEKNFLKDLDETLVDKLENALDEHQSRVKSSVWSSAFLITFVTPFAVYAVNKMFPPTT